MKTEFCPDCVEPMQPYKKKLGYRTNWNRCPKCGLVKGPDASRPTPDNCEERNNLNIDRHYDGE